MKSDFENIYDVYCPMLYSIALQLCPTEVAAEEVIVETFRKIHTQKLVRQHGAPFCMALIKLIIETAKEQLYPLNTTSKFKIREFENTPLLHQLIVQETSIENYCSNNNFTRQQVLIKIRAEFKQILKHAKKNNPEMVVAPFNN